MKSIYKLLALGVLFIAAVSCNQGESLQQYFVDGSANPEFITFDVSSNILNIAEQELSEKEKKTLRSVKKLNVLALKLNEENQETYQTETAKIKTILANSDYQELIRFNTGNAKAVVKYLGADDAIDEVVLYGSDNTKGFAILRIIGDDMNVESVGELVHVIQKGAVNKGELARIGEIFSNSHNNK